MIAPTLGTDLLLAGPNIVLHPQALDESTGSELFRGLLRGIGWQQDALRMYGRTVNLPRLTAWYGDPGARYTYSGIENVPLPWTPELLRLKAVVEELAGEPFNSVLLNRYRDGADSMGWHSDDERGVGPTIASVSLGASRVFELRRKAPPRDSVRLRLAHGSVLLMLGDTQRLWQHRVPKDPASGERINLT
ncbi:MAG: alpha-ketoglutarate-dependent dioxygenase AlkB family protein, partial [Chloroflexota bacterium]